MPVLSRLKRVGRVREGIQRQKNTLGTLRYPRAEKRTNCFMLLIKQEALWIDSEGRTFRQASCGPVNKTPEIGNVGPAKRAIALMQPADDRNLPRE
jgi:hypothetical protein